MQTIQRIDLRRRLARLCAAVLLFLLTACGNEAQNDRRRGSSSSATTSCAVGKVLEVGTCICRPESVELADGTCASTVGCSDNAHQELHNGDLRCQCNDGYAWNTGGTACLEGLSEACPANSHYAVVDGSPGCTCDPGYVQNESGTGCAEIVCPPNSQFNPSDALCHCDEGYVTNNAGNACVASADGCPENSHYDTIGGNAGCYCDPGYEAVNGVGCVLIEETCPEENPSITVNGELLICCPVGSSALLQGGVATCECPEGEYDPVANICPNPPLDGCTNWASWSCTDLSPSLCSCSCAAWPNAGTAPSIHCELVAFGEVACTCTTGGVGAERESANIFFDAAGTDCGQSEDVFIQSFCGLVTGE